MPMRLGPAVHEGSDPPERVFVVRGQLVGREPAELRYVVRMLHFAGDDPGLVHEIENGSGCRPLAVGVQVGAENEPGSTSSPVSSRSSRRKPSPGSSPS